MRTLAERLGEIRDGQMLLREISDKELLHREDWIRHCGAIYPDHRFARVQSDQTFQNARHRLRNRVVAPRILTALQQHRRDLDD